MAYRALCGLLVAGLWVTSVSAAEPTWTREFGTTASDYVRGAVADDSGVFIVGRSDGVLPGETERRVGAFIRRYDDAGNEVWTDQFGGSTSGEAFAVARDDTGVYVVGTWHGRFQGQNSDQSGDAFVRKYNLDGNVVWTRTFDSANSDLPRAVTVDESGVYVVGDTAARLPGQEFEGATDAFVIRMGLSGRIRWIRQFGTTDYDVAWGVTTAAGDVFVTGRHGSDGTFLARYGQTGVRDWLKTGYEAATEPQGIESYGDALYVGGKNSQSFPEGGSNDKAFLWKVNLRGRVLWQRQTGSDSSDQTHALDVGPDGVYLAGRTYGTFPGEQFYGGEEDAFVIKYGFAGALRWARQVGSSGRDEGLAVAAGSRVYVGGLTDGTFPGESHAGGWDAFLVAL